MNFKTRKLVKTPDLSPSGALMGGVLMEWIDEEASIFVMCQLKDNHVVTKYMSEIEFVNPAFRGDIIEIGCELIALGLPFGSTCTNTISSILIIVVFVSLTLTSHFIVIEVRPTFTVSQPISIISLLKAGLTKSISDIYFVTM